METPQRQRRQQTAARHLENWGTQRNRFSWQSLPTQDAFHLQLPCSHSRPAQTRHLTATNQTSCPTTTSQRTIHNLNPPLPSCSASTQLCIRLQQRATHSTIGVLAVHCLWRPFCEGCQLALCRPLARLMPNTDAKQTHISSTAAPGPVVPACECRTFPEHANTAIINVTNVPPSTFGKKSQETNNLGPPEAL